MKLSELKNHLQDKDKLYFKLPNGKTVPKHFHVTEIGQIDKRFIDCGGTLRTESVINMQLWTSIDVHHRLKADKLVNIIDLAENQLGLGDLEIEVEYQGKTIEKFGLEAAEDHFQLTSKQTDCLAKDNCGIPKPKLALSSLTTSECCTPGSGCC